MVVLYCASQDYNVSGSLFFQLFVVKKIFKIRTSIIFCLSFKIFENSDQIRTRNNRPHLAHPFLKFADDFKILWPWLIHVLKHAYDFKIIGTMTKLRQVSEFIFATKKFMYRRQVDIIPNNRLTLWVTT